MHDIEAVLTDCFSEIAKEYATERVDFIPKRDQREKASVPVWKVTLTARTFGKLSDVEVFIAFPREFPYVMPWVIVPEQRFSYLPHISVKSRKLCLFEDGAIYDTTNIYGLIKENISKTRRWLELYSNQENNQEYAKEINSYWAEQYDGESELEPHWILLGTIPEKTCELTGYTYPVDFLGEDNKCFDQFIVCEPDSSADILKNIKTRYKVFKTPVLFVKSFIISPSPPYSMTGNQFLTCISDEEDRKICKKYLNKHREVFFLFPLGLDSLLGGLKVPKLNVFRKGFRGGAVTATDILTKLEYKNKPLGRIRSGIYDKKRIAERTSGTLMEKRNFLVIGLGSVGSNLCYFLNGYNNADFALIDPDNLTLDNLGRHLLGFNYIDQRKVNAVSEYLTLYRPDRKVNAVNKQVEEVSSQEMNKASTIFLCTGDVMSERWLLEKMRNKEITKPLFILWLEPYGISGNMVYVNPEDEESLISISREVADGFMDFCLIDRSEYETGEKIVERDAGCNGQYALYSANDVTLFLSAVFPYIDCLLTNPSESKVYRWIGNIDIANQKGIRLADAAGLVKHSVQIIQV